MLTFADFAKLDIKIGRVLKCERITGSDKLLKVIVDIGDKKIQIVAGMGKYLSPEQIINRQIPVICNIEPTTIFGVKSQGIFVAIDTNPGAVLLLPQQPVKEGNQVR